MQKSQDHTDPVETEVMSPSNSTTANFPLPEACSLDHDRFRTEKCLQICAKALCRLNEAQLELFENRGCSFVGEASFDDPSGLGKAHLMTTAALQDCIIKLNQTLSRLLIHMEEIGGGLPHSSSLAETHMVIRNHHPASKRSLHLGNISTGKDSRQTIVYTAGDDLEVKQATVGDRAVQFIGSVSNDELQKLLGDKSL